MEREKIEATMKRGVLVKEWNGVYQCVAACSDVGMLCEAGSMEV